MKISKNFAKKVSATGIVLIIAMLMLTSTYAWYSATHVENIFTGTKSEPEEPSTSVLHDDFDPETGQKEVYVENTGDSESVIYVRIKLNEFLDLNTNKRPDMIAESDWITHTPIIGADGAYHYEDCENQNPSGDKFHNYFTWHWGSDRSSGTEVNSRKWYLPVSKMTGEYAVYNKGAYADDTTDYSDLSQEEKDALGLKQTPAAGIVSIYDYLDNMDEAQQKAYVGWIYDVDGWAYWSQPLVGGEVTGLLLTSVDVNKDLLKDDDYCYIIDVIMDAVDADDLPMWIDGAASVDTDITDKADKASIEGKTVLDIIKSIPVN